MHKTAKVTGELIGNKISEKIVKLKPVSDKDLRNVEEIVRKDKKYSTN